MAGADIALRVSTTGADEARAKLALVLPRVREYETAMRQLNTAQQALADNNGPQAQIERMRGVVSEVGGRYQSRAQRRALPARPRRHLIQAAGPGPGRKADARPSSRCSPHWAPG